MAPARPYWKGYLKLSLVSCPIALYSATSSTERVPFRQINRTTGNRLRQQLVDDVTREPIEPGEKARGYEVGKNQYLLVEEDELDAVTVESNHTIDIDTFVPRSQIDERYLDSPYYLVPNEPGVRKRSLSSGTRCATKTWLRSLAWFWRSANAL